MLVNPPRLFYSPAAKDSGTSLRTCRILYLVPGIQVHWNHNGTLWASRGYDIVASSDGGQTWTQLTTIPTQIGHRFLARIEPLRRLLRFGIRSYLQLSESELIVFCDGRIFLWRKGASQPHRIGSIRHGSGPLLQGCCLDDQGYCYYGEYWRNPQRQRVSIYRWKQGPSQWDLFYSFANGTIRHIHAVQFDPFSRRVWVATGDHDHESNIGYFETSFARPQLKTIASGTQMARAVSLLFARDYVYWGSDGGRGTGVKANYIYRWSRQTKNIERVADIGGPAYFSTVDREGRLFISTVVEGSASEVDAFARVWMSTDGLNWSEIGRWKKDRYPFVFGYGVLSFPQGLTSGAEVYVVGSGVQGAPGTWVINVGDRSH